MIFAIDCSDGVMPHQRAIALAEEIEDNDQALARERQLLYVTLTRARDEAYITWTKTRSQFLDGLEG